MSKPFGIDVSRWQGTIRWQEIAQHQPTVEFVYIRAGVSWGYIDPQFKANWQGAKQHHIPRGAYHVLYPDVSAERQMINLFNALGSDYGELPIALDMELDRGMDKATVTDCILHSAQIIKAKTGKQPVIYSRALWMDAYTLTGTWRNQFDYWLAQYLLSRIEHPGPPRLPIGVERERCIIHQTTDKGAPFGVESKALDYNRWQLSTSVKEYFGLTQVQKPPMTLEERVADIERRLSLLENC